MTNKEALFRYAVRMGDNSLVLGHRLSEWCGHGPQLEEDIAQANIALDLIGQARNYLTYAGEVEGKGRSEDDLAYLRTDREYLNVQLVELHKGDYAYTIARSFLFDAFHLALQQALTTSTDERLSAIAEKAVKEVTYHLRHSSEWLITSAMERMKVTNGHRTPWTIFGAIPANSSCRMKPRRYWPRPELSPIGGYQG